jgi:hypothetical protein
MEYKINLQSEINNIQNFKSVLEKWKDYKSCIRDIKINTVLGQKCLYEIEDINPPLLCDFSNNDDNSWIMNLNQSAISISKMSFRIDTDLTILELKIDYKVLDTKMGKLVFELQNLGIPLTINPKVMKWVLNKSPQVVGFYIDNEKVSTYIAA